MADELTPQQLGELRLAGWHAAERGEPRDPYAPWPWFQGWHLKHFGVLPSPEARHVGTLRRLLLASIDGIATQRGAETSTDHDLVPVGA